jgi:NAD(P)-dependent dehydrogenase (short-subunit alcohol dehydrogenase family)
VSLVLVLGGTRYLGPPVVRQLIEAGHEVVLFHRGAHAHPDATGAEHVHGDFARFGEYLPRLLGREPEVVIDLAPYIDKDGHGVLHFLGGSARAVVTTSQDVYRWPTEDICHLLAAHSSLKCQSGPDSVTDASNVRRTECERPG